MKRKANIASSSVLRKRADHYNMIACLLCDVYRSLGMVESPRYFRLELQKLQRRTDREGYGFYTKSLPRLGKSLDKALLGKQPLDCTGFRKEPGTQLPKLFGKLFQRVFDLNGRVLPNPCVKTVRSLRQLVQVYYKYELPNDPCLDTAAVKAFKEAEKDVREDVHYLAFLCGSGRDSTTGSGYQRITAIENPESLIRDTIPVSLQEDALYLRRILLKARELLNKLFTGFDVMAVKPAHGPGVVSTKEKYLEKYNFRRVNPRAQLVFPFDKYYFVNTNHLSERYDSLAELQYVESSARVTLVPKDSRGPRVISCEPLENQWFQQGLMRALVPWIERHPLTRKHIRFTDQEVNRMAALAGSYHGELATLDLKEASDRVSLWLVEQLFPSPLMEALTATRSLTTDLPSGEQLELFKFAPMGSATCFPVLALTVWAILTAGLSPEASKSLLVYGDDVIVETTSVEHAIKLLEIVGLHVNLSKSCTSGFFRESCGMDAFMGEDVTPLRIRTVWAESPSAGHYASWVAYANQFWLSGYRTTALFIAERLHAIYGMIPQCCKGIELERQVFSSNTEAAAHLKLSYPAFVFSSGDTRIPRKRYNPALQTVEHNVRVIMPKIVNSASVSGWHKLHRWFNTTEERDDLVRTLLCGYLSRMAQTCLESAERVVGSSADMDEVVQRIAPLMCGSIPEWLQPAAFASTASFSSMTGIPIPIINHCLQEYLRKYYRVDRTGSLHVFPQTHLELHEYAETKRNKLRWAWR